MGGRKGVLPNCSVLTSAPGVYGRAIGPLTDRATFDETVAQRFASTPARLFGDRRGVASPAFLDRSSVRGSRTASLFLRNPTRISGQLSRAGGR